MNWVAERQSGPFWAQTPSELGAQIFCCDLRDPLMREVCLTGRYEPQETQLLQQLLQPGMTFVDVGANWGYFTLLGAHLVGPNGRVLSVEADPAACRSLRANVAKNGLSHVAIVAAAASDKPAVIMVQAYDDGRDGWSNAGVTLAASPGSRGIQVEARPLDMILDSAGIGRIDLLKMDIEGAECRALSGLQRRLAAGDIDRIVVELHPSHLEMLGSSVAAVVSLLRRYGYRGWRIDHSAETHRRAAVQSVDVEALLSPIGNGDELGTWPHVLWSREDRPLR
jgi:FkbM family methyltransferase